ncbi:STAS domain-containing protein [Magnetospirillum sp. SS-4]|uniref:STAS domain-containing protein n=1 Tax=Magnetospirillum sp. SS-4 TaxID=2681465 RepID=UPI00137DB668|nr:STAS domain-containing protein [Magnetospirillum sp. SS-4]CAA7624881.1 STAS domain protein [Magnetospirillum sp. SS-4]
MEFEFNPAAAALRVTLRGRLTFAENPRFRQVLSHIGSRKAKRVVIDLAHVDFIDSAGLGMLMHARDAARRHDGIVTLDAARGQVDRMLGLARLHDVFRG